MSVVELLPVLDMTGERQNLRELARGIWRHRTLLPVLARQSFQSKYRAASAGLVWAVVQPLARGAVLAVVFTVVVPIETDAPYVAFVMSGTATWAYMTEAVSSGTMSIVTTGVLAGRIYFPRMLLPAMPAATALPPFLITLVVVVGISTAVGAPPNAHLLVLPAAVALAAALGVSVALVGSLLHVHSRDVGHLVANALMLGFYATPVIYPQDQASGLLGDILQANPFTGPIALVRWCLIGAEEPLATPLLWTAGWTALFATIGVAGFQRLDRTCVDRL